MQIGYHGCNVQYAHGKKISVGRLCEVLDTFLRPQNAGRESKESDCQSSETGRRVCAVLLTPRVQPKHKLLSIYFCSEIL
jgi:hypothetical protein